VFYALRARTRVSRGVYTRFARRKLKLRKGYMGKYLKLTKIDFILRTEKR